MRITILAVGKIRHGIFNQLYEHYASRLRWEVILHEIESLSQKNPHQRRKDEAIRLLALVPDNAQIVTLDESGKVISSRELASWMGRQIEEGIKDICLIIGGAQGLESSILLKSHLIIALGRATWPHLLVRGMIAEQLYRIQQILSGHPYHKD
jgi:23S rRNA (pseudouridine1915-N3)-methyltransferase